MAGATMETMSKAKTEGVAVIEDFLDVFLGILLPIALALIGFFVLAPVVGLSGFYNSFMAGAGLQPSLQNAVADFAAVVTYVGLGTAFVGVEMTYDGYIGDVVGAAGWMLNAMGLREIVNWALNGTPMAPSGPLAQLATRLSSGLTNAAQGG